MFGLPDAKGLLVILNDRVDILEPRVIAHRVHQTLAKRAEAGKPRYAELDAVWIVSETHRVKISDTLAGMPAVILTHPLKEADASGDFFSSLQKPWADYCGLPLVELAEDSYDGLEFARPPRDGDGTMTLSDLWRAQYRDYPYLRQFHDNELLLYGARVSVEMAMAQRSNHATRFAMLRSTRRWGELIEELNHRRIDVRQVRDLAIHEGMHVFEESRAFWQETSLLADDCDVRLEI